jgi:hypothetical protein
MLSWKIKNQIWLTQIHLKNSLNWRWEACIKWIGAVYIICIWIPKQFLFFPCVMKSNVRFLLKSRFFGFLWNLLHFSFYLIHNESLFIYNSLFNFKIGRCWKEVFIDNLLYIPAFADHLNLPHLDMNEW